MKTQFTENQTEEEIDLPEENELNQSDWLTQHWRAYKGFYILICIVVIYSIVCFAIYALKLESFEDNKYKRIKFTQGENYP